MEIQIPWWLYLKDAILIAGIAWIAVIYATDAKATKNQLKTLQKTQDALLSQANTLRAHIETNLQLLDRLKSEELLKEVQSARKAFKLTAQAKVEEIGQRLAKERDDALKGKKTWEEWAKSFATAAKESADQATEASLILGAALYRLPKSTRTKLLDALESAPVKAKAVHMLKELESEHGPSPADGPYDDVTSLSLLAYAVLGPSSTPDASLSAYARLLDSLPKAVVSPETGSTARATAVGGGTNIPSRRLTETRVQKSPESKE
jgi:hypothetical protein